MTGRLSAIASMITTGMPSEKLARTREREARISSRTCSPLIQPVMRDGRRLALSPTLAEIRARAAADLARLPEPLRRLEADGAAGVSSVPTYWLLDAEGEIVAKTDDLDELAKVLEDRLKPAPGGR